MSEIEAGEYIRTNTGIISKLEYIEIELNKKYYWFEKTIYYSYEDAIDFLKEEEIEKHIKAHSKNIIDLIEEGDIVELINGLNKNEFIRIQYSSELDIIKSHKIISILTHEQYGQNCYKVVE